MNFILSGYRKQLTQMARPEDYLGNFGRLWTQQSYLQRCRSLQFWLVNDMVGHPDFLVCIQMKTSIACHHTYIKENLNIL